MSPWLHISKGECSLCFFFKKMGLGGGDNKKVDLKK